MEPLALPFLTSDRFTTRLARFAARCRDQGLLFALALVSLVSMTGCEQSMIARANEAAAVLREFKTGEGQIPSDTLASAEAIAILHESEVGVVVTAGGGKGVMVRRTTKGWSAPLALDTSNGSIGAQIGGQGRDIVMVFRNPVDVAKMLAEDGFAIADASATAGAASGSAGSDGNTVLTYAKTAGLFAGARVGGVGFRINRSVNNETYGYQWSPEDILAGKVERPLGVRELYDLLPPTR
jgi:lipid-binding SYLF domain-containing protein